MKLESKSFNKLTVSLQNKIGSIDIRDSLYNTIIEMYDAIRERCDCHVTVIAANDHMISLSLIGKRHTMELTLNKIGLTIKKELDGIKSSSLDKITTALEVGSSILEQLNSKEYDVDIVYEFDIPKDKEIENLSRLHDNKSLNVSFDSSTLWYKDSCSGDTQSKCKLLLSIAGRMEELLEFRPKSTVIRLQDKTKLFNTLFE